MEKANFPAIKKQLIKVRTYHQKTKEEKEKLLNMIGDMLPDREISDIDTGDFYSSDLEEAIDNYLINGGYSAEEIIEDLKEAMNQFED